MHCKRTIATTATAAALTIGGTAVAAAAEYTVAPGDTLSEIAGSYSGDWQDVYRTNRDVIGADPDVIYPGQVLTIGGANESAPEVASSADAATAPVASVSLPATGHVTSDYGMRTHPITGAHKLHSGTDFAVGDGNAYAVKDGVATVSHPEWAGNLVTVDHGDGVQTTYGHLASVNVGNGEHVNAGEVVGRIGSRGYSTGPHLHFEVLRHGEYTDPIGWLADHGVGL